MKANVKTNPNVNQNASNSGSTNLLEYFLPEVTLFKIALAKFTGAEHPYFSYQVKKENAEKQQGQSPVPQQPIQTPQFTVPKPPPQKPISAEEEKSNKHKEMALHALRNSNSNNQAPVSPQPMNEQQVPQKPYNKHDLYANSSEGFREDILKLNLEHALNQLNEIVGLDDVKKFVEDLKNQIELEQARRENGLSVGDSTYHMIFTGNPGTGKTTVARIVADILAGLGVVSNGHVIEAQRSDLVGAHLGESALFTNKLVQDAIGGILFIDEAYALVQDKNDSFGKEAVATLIKGMEDNRDNLVVILAGYTKEMDEFLKSNSGLKSRFPRIIEFADYTPEQLLEIMKIQLAYNDFIIDEKTEKSIFEVLQQQQIPGLKDTGNGRLVRNLLDHAKGSQASRLKRDGYSSTDDLKRLTSEDFGVLEDAPQFDLEKELSKIVGNEHLKESIRELANTVKLQKMRQAKGIKTSAAPSMHMVFKGNAGTGKTTVARIIAKLFKELGVIKRGHLVEVDRSGLVGAYVGHTEEKTADVIQKALGGVLFIDEAYALAEGGTGNDFGQKAIDALVKAMEDYRENLIVIVAGYEQDMDRFLATNDGLKSRFPFHFDFKDYSLSELFHIALLQLKSRGLFLESTELKEPLEKLLEPAVGNRTAGNGRYVRNLIDEIARKQDSRLVKLNDPSEKELQTITLNDLQGVSVKI